MAISPIIVLQVLVGLGLFFGHGLGKIKNVPGTMGAFQKMGFGKLGGLYASLVEGVGSLLLIAGIFPRVMAGLIIVLMLGALLFHRRNKDPFMNGWEAPYLYLSAAIVILLAGVSPWGLSVA